MRRAGGAGLGRAMARGKSHAKVYVEADTKVTFKDVAGVDEAKFGLEEVVSLLRVPDSYGRLGARLPKGILLVGPPGTGKTLLARAVTGEAALIAKCWSTARTARDGETYWRSICATCRWLTGSIPTP